MPLGACGMTFWLAWKWAIGYLARGARAVRFGLNTVRQGKMAADEALNIPVEDRDQLVAYLEAGCKPEGDWRIGTEHEKFPFRKSDYGRVAYEGASGVGALLDGLTRFGWRPVIEHGTVIALEHDGQAITLEPGGQFELSGAMLDNLHQTCDEVHTHLAQIREIADELDIGFLGIGFDPKHALADVPVMPKSRYDIMRRYMPTKGGLGLEMMFRTCTVQVNLDFRSEADMVRKFRLGLALQPIATALFANSPFTEGAANGYLSFRSHAWTDTDPDRCGTLPFVHEDGFGFERYADYALDVPMYFVHRERYIDAAGQSFRDFLAGRLPALPGEKPVLSDWVDHLTTIFPEVRLKQFLEMRGADGGPWASLCALPALWVGLCYDRVALDEAAELIRDWTADDIAGLRDQVTRTALGTRFRGRTVLDIARDVVAIADRGLARRARLDGAGSDERGFLKPLKDTVNLGQTPAEELLALYHGRWHGSVDPIYEEFAY